MPTLHGTENDYPATAHRNEAIVAQHGEPKAGIAWAIVRTVAAHVIDSDTFVGHWNWMRSTKDNVRIESSCLTTRNELAAIDGLVVRPSASDHMPSALWVASSAPREMTLDSANRRRIFGVEDHRQPEVQIIIRECDLRVQLVGKCPVENQVRRCNTTREATKFFLRGKEVHDAANRWAVAVPSRSHKIRSRVPIPDEVVMAVVGLVATRW